MWKITSKDYSNRNKEHEALTKLMELCKAVCPHPTLEYGRNKIANLRNVPHLWYFESLRFLTNQVDAIASPCTPKFTSAASPEHITHYVDHDISEDISISQVRE